MSAKESSAKNNLESAATSSNASTGMSISCAENQNESGECTFINKSVSQTDTKTLTVTLTLCQKGLAIILVLSLQNGVKLCGENEGNRDGFGLFYE